MTRSNDEIGGRVVLVDAADSEIGTAEKLEAHRRGLLHRAISVLIRDSRGRLLLQKRSAGKYHSGSLWTNCCCSHPRPGEAPLEAAHRRLREEMGFDCPLKPLGVTSYRAAVGDGMTEHELVHLFAGTYDGPVMPDPGEADGFAWTEETELAADLAARPGCYTAWFRHYAAASWPLLAIAEPLRAES
ncbi:MAG TPA: isopentenyl-diphosphate Delta-isomerase [Afifellaceae bacterium]|nr:isopentenyl-diphosphate Delta-isomerase [Afifellaceae bacterium]